MHPEYEETADLTRIMGGHEIWLGEARLEKDQAEMALLYGDNMRPDGSLDPKRINPTVYNPDGSTLKPTLSSEKDRHRLSFPCAGDGCYTAIVDLVPRIITQDNEGTHIGPKFQFKNVIYSGAVVLMAKRILPVGGAQPELKDPVHGILEIVPRKPEFFQGEEAEIRVFYEDKPLTEVEVKAVSEKEGKLMAKTKTDDQGWARVPLTVPGDWMFMVVHRDPTKKVNDEFDFTNFVSTLVVETK
jgi:uncharacterized GH25 family protein